ncbi:protein of unknown function [Candidatus Methylocalor cossyra]|uniref:Uncharacterized protein n=1 Tax=Candidatus Methylocalor cossyra TaxID=3108543 RepID=A0ABM9NLE6_9GAMM
MGGGAGPVFQPGVAQQQPPEAQAHPAALRPAHCRHAAGREQDRPGVARVPGSGALSEAQPECQSDRLPGARAHGDERGGQRAHRRHGALHQSRQRVHVLPERPEVPSGTLIRKRGALPSLPDVPPLRERRRSVGASRVVQRFVGLVQKRAFAPRMCMHTLSRRGRSA